MTVHAGDVLDDTKQVSCTSCGNRFEIEGRHAAPACPECGATEFEESA
ncbi:MAG TPA: hypothetical protein VM841_03870 [Actinomycetota bacterium]|nr:hypothetical protein [Actinomycetota bacterium]